MIASIISVLILVYYICLREWLVLLALMCWHAVKLVDYIYPGTLPVWLFLSVAGVTFLMIMHQFFKQSPRRAAASVR